MKKNILLLTIAFIFSLSLKAQYTPIVYSYEGDFNEESVNFGLKITSSTTHTGHTHHGDYLIVIAQRRGSVVYHFRLNSEHMIPYFYDIERVSGSNYTDDIQIFENTSTGFNMEIRFGGVQDDWHRITVHELSPPRGSAPTFLKIDPSQFQTGGTKVDLAIISKDGSSVGIGIASPTEKFHIYGSGPTRALVESSDNHAYYVVEGAAGKGSFVDYYRNGDGRIWHTGLRDASNNFEFRLNDQSTVLALKEDGNVGIGTTFPSNKLEVNGTIRSKEVIVEATGWPDFVFYPDYNLPSLEEVEQYINENKHLPEVPSEAEVQEHGIKLGEMDATLLQKIEELTLYVIEQNKLNKTQQELIEAQSKMIEELKKEVLKLKDE